MQHSETHCKQLQHNATQCNTMQHMQRNATQCNTLQHTATHCITNHGTNAPQQCCILQFIAPNYMLLHYSQIIFIPPFSQRKSIAPTSQQQHTSMTPSSNPQLFKLHAGTSVAKPLSSFFRFLHSQNDFGFFLV